MTNTESFLEREYEVECFSGTYKLRPSRVWILYSFVAGFKRRVNVVGVFKCPDGSVVTKRIATFDDVLDLT